MLVLLLSLFSNYGLYHCYRTGHADSSERPLEERIHKSVHEIDSLLEDFQLEIQKEKAILRTVAREVKDIGLLDYSITSVWWGESTTTVQPETTTTFLPIPKGHLTTSPRNPWERLALPGVQTNYSTSDDFEVVPHHGHVPDPGYDLNQTPYNPYLTYSPPETSRTPRFVRPTSLSYPLFRSTRPSPTVPEHYFNYVDKEATYPAESPIPRAPRKSPVRGFKRPVTARSILRGVTMSELYKKVMRDRTGSKTYEKRLLKAHRLATAPHRPQNRGRTLSKAQLWVQNREWLKSKKPEDKLLRHIRQGTGEQVEKPVVDEKPAEVENPPAKVENPPFKVENPPVENQNRLAENQNRPAKNQNPPAENLNQPTLDEHQPANNERQPAVNENQMAETENRPAVDENAPVVEPANNAENAPVKETTAPSDSLDTFSLPAFTDMISSLSIPGLDEVELTTAGNAALTSTSSPNLLSVDVTTTMEAFTQELFHEDDQGFLYVMSPATIYEPATEKTTLNGQILLNAENFTATTPAKVTDSFQQVMEKRDEGFLVTFFLELSRLVAQKRLPDVAAVLGHAEMIYNDMYEKGSLTFLGEQVMELGTKFSRMCSGNDVTIIQSHANMMNQMLTGRDQFLSVEVNSVIDYADLLIEDDEGESLFESLRTFEAFPNAGVSGFDLCRQLIDNFLRPYRRLRGTERLRKLTDSLTTVVAKKFGRRSLDWAATPGEHHPPKQKVKHQLPLKPKLQKRRYQKFRPRAQPGYRPKRRRLVYTTQRIDRSVLPITSHQRRFHVITPRQLRSNGYLNLVRPTLEYFKRRLGRPVHPPNGMLQLFPQAKMEDMRRAQIAGENHHPSGSANQQKLGAMRDKLRRIVAESSYSDEESSLKRNLRQALRVHHHRHNTSSSSS